MSNKKGAVARKKLPIRSDPAPLALMQSPTSPRAESLRLPPNVERFLNARSPVADEDCDLDALAAAVALSREMNTDPDPALRVDHLASEGGSVSQVQFTKTVRTQGPESRIEYHHVMKDLAPQATKERLTTIKPPAAPSTSRPRSIRPERPKEIPGPKEPAPTADTRKGWFSLATPKTVEEALSFAKSVMKYAGIKLEEDGDNWVVYPALHPDMNKVGLETYLNRFSGPDFASFVNWIKKNPNNASAASQGCYPAHDFCGRRLKSLKGSELDPCCVCLATLKGAVPQAVPPAPAPPKIPEEIPVVRYIPAPEVLQAPPNPSPQAIAPPPPAIPQPPGSYEMERPFSSLYDILKRGVVVITKRGKGVRLPVPKKPAAIQTLQCIRGTNWREMIKRYIPMLYGEYLKYDYDYNKIVYE